MDHSGDIVRADCLTLLGLSVAAAAMILGVDR